jgi:hypothetical protein
MKKHIHKITAHPHNILRKVSAKLETANWDPVATVDSFLVMAAQTETNRWKVLRLQMTVRLL